MRTTWLILALMIITTSCQAQKKTNLQDNDVIKTKIENYLNSLSGEGFSGSVLIDIKGAKVLSNGYGLSDRKNQIKNEPNTVFDIGSITKQFTAAGILKLEMMGKLSVSDKLSKYFNDIPDDKKNLMIHHLLTHSSGLPSGIGDDYQVISTENFIDRALVQKLLFTPGEEYEYSNVGYSLLGIIIEKVSGKTYEEFLYKNLWKPANMENTGYTIPSFNQKLVAEGYHSRGKKWGKPNNQVWDKDAPYWNLKANGGIMSTTEDMYKWHKALTSDKVLSSEARKKLFTPYIREGSDAPSYYGYGWAIYNTSRNTRMAAHNGGNGIFFADFWRYLDDNVTIILMTNSSTRYSGMIASQIAQIIFLPDFKPSLPSEMDSRMVEKKDDFDDNDVRQLSRQLVEILNDNNKDKWRAFITKYGAEEFIDMASMETHLNFFNKFHKRIKGGKIKTIKLEDGELTVAVYFDDASKDVINIMIGLLNNEDGLKFEGIMLN